MFRSRAVVEPSRLRPMRMEISTLRAAGSSSMSNSKARCARWSAALVALAAIWTGGLTHIWGQGVTTGAGPSGQPQIGIKSTMENPYRLVDNWPRLGKIPPGGATGLIPDGNGGVWMLHRSEPPIVHIDASGNIVKSF